jgi:hypothetical protein
MTRKKCRQKKWRGPRDLYEDGRRCPRSVKHLRAFCEHLKKHIGERASRAEENATSWDGDGQRWAAFTLISFMFKDLVPLIDKHLDRLNALLHAEEMAGGEPINAIIALGKELGLDKRCKDWEARARATYQPAAQRTRPRRRNRRAKLR